MMVSPLTRTCSATVRPPSTIVHPVVSPVALSRTRVGVLSRPDVGRAIMSHTPATLRNTPLDPVVRAVAEWLVSIAPAEESLRRSRLELHPAARIERQSAGNQEVRIMSSMWAIS